MALDSSCDNVEEYDIEYSDSGEGDGEDEYSEENEGEEEEIYTIETFLINHTLKQFIYIGQFQDLRFDGLCRYTKKFGWDVYNHRIDILRNINDLTFLKKYALVDMCEEQLKRINLHVELLEAKSSL